MNKLYQKCKAKYDAEVSQGNKNPYVSISATELATLILEGIKKKLAETYGVDSVVSIYGKDSVDVRNQAVEKFQNKEECRFLVGNPTVGGYGLTLTAAKYVIYFSNSYNLEVRQQSEDRAHRIGQKSQVTYIDIIARDTIDQMVLHNLENKIELSAKTLGEQVQKWL